MDSGTNLIKLLLVHKFESCATSARVQHCYGSCSNVPNTVGLHLNEHKTKEMLEIIGSNVSSLFKKNFSQQQPAWCSNAPNMLVQQCCERLHGGLVSPTNEPIKLPPYLQMSEINHIEQVNTLLCLVCHPI